MGFENDVKMYGTQTKKYGTDYELWFENDVKMYGTQTGFEPAPLSTQFENDVKFIFVNNKNESVIETV